MLDPSEIQTGLDESCRSSSVNWIVKSAVIVVDPSVTNAVTGFDPRQLRLTAPGNSDRR